jgi:signal peptidase I
VIYGMNLLKKEFSYGYYQKRDGVRQLVGLGVFFGMLAFSLYFMMQTLSQSALSDDAPYFMRPSYFSVVFLYLAVSGVGFLFYFINRFGQISFAEVYDNSWYCMAHLGYSVGAMVMTKLFAQIVSVLIVHTAGFAVTLMLTSILKFPLVAGYLISQYFVGLMNAVALLTVAMLLSMLGRDRSSAKSWLAFLALVFFLLQFPSGFFAIATDWGRMGNFLNLWTDSWYLWMMVGVAVAATMVCVRRGAHLAGMFNPPAETGAPSLTGRLPEGTVVQVQSACDNAFTRRQSRRLAAAYLPARRLNILSLLSTLLLAVVVVSMLAVNLALLAFAYASPEKETFIAGYIPYIFQSSTMQPAVQYNDIAFFEKIDGYVQVSEGDIVLFKDDAGAVQVRKILNFYADAATGEERITADITHYGDGAQQEALKTTLRKEQIYGRLVGRNRYLGVVVLFANTMLGRLLFLLIPTVLIFFSGPIFALIRQIGRAHGHGPVRAHAKSDG